MEESAQCESKKQIKINAVLLNCIFFKKS